MKKILKKILQKYANFIYNRVKNAKTMTDVDLWFSIGMGLNRWCVKRDIWLD